VKLFMGAGQMRGRESGTREKEKVMVAREALGGRQVGRDDAITAPPTRTATRSSP
jgi:hypothetical protein